MGVYLFYRGYATFHSRVCHRSPVSMPLFTRGYVTFLLRVYRFSPAGMSPFTRGSVTFHSWAYHLSLVGLSPFTRAYDIFLSRLCHLSLADLPPLTCGHVTFTVQPRICPNIPVISSFAIKHSFLCLVVYCFHLLMSIMFFFSHASLTNVTKKWSASNCDLKTPSRAARIWNPKFECNEAWNPSNGKSLRSWPQP